MLPTVVVAIAFQSFLGQNGALNQALMALFRLDAAPIMLEGTLGIILIAHVFYNFSIALKIISSYWSSIPPSVEQAARSLGCQPLAALA